MASLFDILGFLAPIIFYAKLFLKLLWTAKLDWDQPLPEILKQQWVKFCESLLDIKKLKIPRFMSTNPSSTDSIVGFCDASERGYAAVVYLHSRSETGQINVHLIQSKTKVGPLKPMSIPKMELNGAVLLSKLIKEILDGLPHLEIQNIVLYCDSKITLAWIHSPPHILKTFIANRVSKIQTISVAFKWFYVESKNNPADLACRGVVARDLVNNQMWWQGPPFLKQDYEYWPKDRGYERVKINSEFLKNANISLAVKDLKKPSYLYSHLLKVGKYSKLVRIQAMILRFINNCKNKVKNKKNGKDKNENKRVGPILVIEYRIALRSLIKISEHHFFSDTIKELNKEENVTSPLKKLNPFVDSEGVLRVGGRLENSELKYETKHPIILPKKCHLTKLIIIYYHESFLHAGSSFLKAMLRTQFWILSVHSSVKNIIYHCSRCVRFAGKPASPLMADLPEARVRPARPFTHTGLDFAGPFKMKSYNVRRAPIVKGYFCVFICLFYKAVHIDFVSQLTTEAFLAALQRFVSRRGLPKKLYSDQGKNFIGADNYLKEVYAFLEENSELITTHLAEQNIEWKFNPSYTPHYGGLWERAIRSIKGLLYKQINVQVFTFEEYATLVARIDAILNSRPLCPLKEETDDNNFLTPATILTGGSLCAVPEEPIDENTSIVSRYEKLNQLIQSIWKKWVIEYLNTMTERGKWTKKEKNLKIGQLVYITDLHTNP